MKIELNVGLYDGTTGGASDRVVQARLALLQVYLNEALPGGNYRLRVAEASYTRGNGILIREATAVAAFNREALTLKHQVQLKPFLFMVAEALMQDCIAMFDVEANAGELIGPKASDWGEFEPEFFTRVDSSRFASATI